MIIIILLLLIFIVLVYNYYIHYGRNGKLINLIPGPSGYPISGNILQYLCSREKQWKLLTTMTDQYYPVFKIWAFFTSFVSIRHPDDLEKILSNMKHINKNIPPYYTLHAWLGTGLLTSEGAKWHSRRKILTPTFHFNILQQFVEILIQEGASMTRSLENTGGTIVKDLIPFISEHTLNAICETAMGVSLQDLGAFQHKYRKAVHQMGELVIYRFLRQWLKNDWIYSLFPKGREQIKTLKILHGFTDRIIVERKLYHECTNDRYLKSFDNDTSIRTDDSKTIGIKKRLAMLDLLIAASRKGHLTDTDIREEVDTFMFEGHDTTAMNLCYLLVLLAEHKDIQDRVRNEIDTVIQESGGKFSVRSLQNLSYLERCIKEALRLYPSVYFIARCTGEDVKLQSYLVPTGTYVHLNIYGVHRDPNFWPNPEIFDPDRFLPEKIQKRHPYSYIPFSAGPRNCIGQRYAMLEMKAMVAHLIHNFYLEPVDYLKNLRMHVDLILRPSHPLRVKFIPIKSM